MNSGGRIPIQENSIQILACIVFFIGINASQAAAIQTPADSSHSHMLGIRKGDRCIVCNAPHEHVSQVILYKGRRVPVCAKHPQTFLNNPQPYFSQLQPRGALFQEEAVLEKTMKSGWFALGMWVFVALISAGLAANLALRKGLSSLRWFFVGLVTSVFGVAWLLFKPSTQRVDLPAHFAKIPTTANPIYCPDCQAGNHPSAEKCGGCGRSLEPLSQSEVRKLGL
ncbi:MAG: hypothetical protein V3U73_06190 [bacterium]